MNLLERFPAIAFSAIVAILSSQAAHATTLYQWTGSDGTPTYSPDPPPKGVSYTIVGADLQPIQGQAPVTQTAAQPKVPAQALPNPQPTAQPSTALPTPFTANRKSNVVIVPAPGSAEQPQTTPKKSKTPWKPVKYADDPNPGANQPVITRATELENVEPPLSSVSSQCIAIKQKRLALEGLFANAQTAKEMDDAILRLSKFRKQTDGMCGR